MISPRYVVTSWGSHGPSCLKQFQNEALRAMTESTTTRTSLVPRHGRGDRLIKLNVGGKEFQTLQSTLQASPVLAEYCARAEANGELESSGAIFIDRGNAQRTPIVEFDVCLWSFLSPSFPHPLHRLTFQTLHISHSS